MSDPETSRRERLEAEAAAMREVFVKVLDGGELLARIGDTGRSFLEERARLRAVAKAAREHQRIREGQCDCGWEPCVLTDALSDLDASKEGGRP
jgi:hypothetical protein